MVGVLISRLTLPISPVLYAYFSCVVLHGHSSVSSHATWQNGGLQSSPSGVASPVASKADQPPRPLSHYSRMFVDFGRCLNLPRQYGS